MFKPYFGCVCWLTSRLSLHYNTVDKFPVYTTINRLNHLTNRVSYWSIKWQDSNVCRTTNCALAPHWSFQYMTAITQWNGKKITALQSKPPFRAIYSPDKQFLAPIPFPFIHMVWYKFHIFSGKKNAILDRSEIRIMTSRDTKQIQFRCLFSLFSRCLPKYFGHILQLWVSVSI